MILEKSVFKQHILRGSRMNLCLVKQKANYCDQETESMYVTFKGEEWEEIIISINIIGYLQSIIWEKALSPLHLISTLPHTT
jgi:hypothetical protein